MARSETETYRVCPVCKRTDIHYRYYKRHLTGEHGWVYTKDSPNDPVSPYSDVQLIELAINERRNMPAEKRDLPGLVAVLRKLADDLISGRAVEMDFSVEIEDLNNYEMLHFSIDTYHQKTGHKSKTQIK